MRHNDSKDQNRLVGSTHQGDPLGNGMPRACATSQYNNGPNEGSGEIFESIKGSTEAG